jgi:hypothetical protein
MLRQERRLKLFENRVLRRIFELKSDERIGDLGIDWWIILKWI